MINIAKLRGIMAEHNVTKSQMAAWLGVTVPTLTSRLNSNTLTIEQTDTICDKLDISNPVPIFFAQYVSE